MSKPAEMAAAAKKRRARALAAARRQARETKGHSAYEPATTNQRIELSRLHADLHAPAPRLEGLTRAQASRAIGKARAQWTRIVVSQPCPTCGAAPGKPCQNTKPRRGTRTRRYMHTLRAIAARSRTP